MYTFAIAPPVPPSPRCLAMLVNEDKPQFQFKKSSSVGKFEQYDYLGVSFCYEQNRCVERTVDYLQGVPKKGYSLKSSASAACSNLNANSLMSPGMRKTLELGIFMLTLRINLRILGNMRH